MKNGYRSNDSKKTRLINIVNLQLVELGAKGVNIPMLLKVLNITGDAQTIPTKKWAGVISALKSFRKENNV